MEHLVDTELVRSLGISNFNVSVILDLLRHARIRPATLQIEHHPYLVQKPLIDFVTKEGITVTAYSSFGPTGYVEMDLDHAVQAPHLFQHPVVNGIAKAHGKSAPQVLLRWSTQQGIAVIPKSDTTSMLLENLDAKGFDLSEEEIKKINGLNLNLRFNDPLMVRFLNQQKDETDKMIVFWLPANLQLIFRTLASRCLHPRCTFNQQGEAELPLTWLRSSITLLVPLTFLTFHQLENNVCLPLIGVTFLNDPCTSTSCDS